jgi:glycosyltransferase involved in cell wall biosynthesis
VAGEHLLAASTPEGYAAAILRILGDPGERRRLAEAGRARMLSHHTWESAMRRLDAILERTLATAAGERR